MESALVSARVPRAKKEAAAAILASLGATASELVNNAYDFLLAEGRLPGATVEQPFKQEAFEKFVQQSTLAIDWGDDAADGDYKRLIAAQRAASYESLA